MWENKRSRLNITKHYTDRRSIRVVSLAFGTNTHCEGSYVFKNMSFPTTSCPSVHRQGHCCTCEIGDGQRKLPSYLLALVRKHGWWRNNGNQLRENSQKNSRTFRLYDMDANHVGGGIVEQCRTTRKHTQQTHPKHSTQYAVRNTRDEMKRLCRERRRSTAQKASRLPNQERWRTTFTD